MTRTRLPLYARKIARRSAGCLFILLFLTLPVPTLAHGGHGNEFQGDQAAQSAGAVPVDVETAKRMGLKVEPVSRQRLVFGIKTTGKIEALPN